MKQPYKIQNRTSESRRVKFVKNGGTVSFPKTATASFIENSRDAGFCLTAITPIPPRENATNSITLTSHPMGTDGRVSLFVNDTLIESKRFLNKSRIADRQAWFNSEFGAYAVYSGKELATFTTAIVSADVYRFVFEDDDLDYVFADTTNATGDVNPTLVVEQYRLAFNIMNNKIEISCDGAHYESPYMSLTGDWQLEINGVKYTTLDTPIEEMLAMIEATDVAVVYEDDASEPEPEVEVIKDYTLTGWYNPELQRFEGFIRPTAQFIASVTSIAEDDTDVTADVVTDGQGRWYYATALTDVSAFYMTTYLGDLEDPENMIGGEELYIEDFTLPDYRKADGDIIATYGKTYVVQGDTHLYYKLSDGVLRKEQIPMAEMWDYGSEIPLNITLASFLNTDEVNPLGLFFMKYTNSLGLLGDYTEIINPTFVDFTFFTPKPGRVALAEPVSVTLYRGMASGSEDLFDLLFPNVKENYVTLTATATVDTEKFTTPTPSIAVTTGEVIQFCNGPFGGTFRIIDTTNPDDLKVTTTKTSELLDTKGLVSLEVDYSELSNWYMNFNATGDELAISVNGYRGVGGGISSGVSALYSLQRTAPGTYDFMRMTETSDMSSHYPTITDGYLSWISWSNYMIYQPSELPGLYEISTDWGFGSQIVSAFEIAPHMQIFLIYRWMNGVPSYQVRQALYVPADNGFVVTESLEGFEYNPSINTNGFKPSCIKLTETHTLIVGGGRLVLVTHSPTNDVPPTFVVLENKGQPQSVTEVARTDTEVYFILTDGLDYTYRFEAMNLIDHTTRTISTGHVGDIGGRYGFPISDKVAMFAWSQYPAHLTFCTFDLDTGLVSQNSI